MNYENTIKQHESVKNYSKIKGLKGTTPFFSY